MDIVNVSFRYSEQEYTRAVRTHYRSKLRLPIDIVVTGALLAGGIYELRSGSTAYGIFLLSGCGVFVLILIAALAAIPKLAWQRQPKLHENYSFTFTPDGIHFQTEHIDSQLQWNMYTHAVVDRDSFLLYYGADQFTVVPKRIFQDVNAREAFERLIVSNVPRVVQKAKS